MTTDILDINTVTIEHVNPKSLQPHPRNVKIYGDEVVVDLKERILASKWIKPLVITSNNLIISGHRRWRAVSELGLLTVPVERRTFASEIEELEALLLENVSREKTVVQKVNEGKTWDHIYSKRAATDQEAQEDIGREHGKEGGRPSAIHALKTKEAKPLEDTCPQGVLPEKPYSTPQETPKLVSQLQKKKERKPQTRDKVAAQVGLGSGKTYERAEKVVDAANELEEKGHVGEAEVLRKTLNAPKSVNVAVQVAELPEKEQIAVLNAVATGKAKDVKEAKSVVKREELVEQAKTTVLPDSIQLLEGNFLEIGQQIADGSIDLLFTDPPYHETHLELWSSLAIFAAKKLKPGGILLAYSGQLFLPQVLATLSAHLEYCWLLGVAHSKGHTQIWKHHLWNDWKPIVMFSNGKTNPDNHEWFMDLYRGDKGDKSVHEWSQGEGEAAYFIEKLTQHGQLIVDPMCGSGTILRAAHKLGRNSIGMEIDGERYKVAKAGMRGLEVVSV